MMKQSMMAICVAVAVSGTASAEEELKDPRTRDDDISGTVVEASVTRLSSGIYEYIYRIAAPETNKGSIRGIKIALACDLDFGEIAWPEPPEPVFQGDHSKVPHVPVQMYIDPEQTSAMSITAKGEAYWGLGMDPGEAGERYRMLSPAPPALRRFELEPSWRTTGYDYGSLTDEELDTVPWIADFRVSGMIEAPACSLAPEPEPDLYAGSGEETVNDYLAYASPLRDQFTVPADQETIEINIHYGDDIDPRTFKVQPGWAKRFFAPQEGTSETVRLPLRESVNRFHLEVRAVQSPGPRKDDELHHSLKDRDTFVIRREAPGRSGQ